MVNNIIKAMQVYDGIPFTTYYKDDNKPKSILFFFHGFSSNREIGIMGRGEILANLGFYVIAIDAYLHGERETAFFQKLNYQEKHKEIINVVIQTANDAKKLYQKYFKPVSNEVYAYGVSMGAIVAFYLATIMDELKTFASIVGTPSFVEFYEYKQSEYNWALDDYYFTNLKYYEKLDPFINYESLKEKNIFMGVGLHDFVVPLKHSKELASKLRGSNIVYKEYDIGHSSTPKMQDDAYNFLINKS